MIKKMPAAKAKLIAKNKRNGALDMPAKKRKPIMSKEHEARETPAQERKEHETGYEIQDED